MLLTKIIDFVFPHDKLYNKDEKTFWDNHWNEMIQYYQKNGEIFEINNKWDFYCNEAIHNHYKSIVKNFKNLSCIECGCGDGYESSLMAKEGARVTVSDYSKRAIEYAKVVSRRLGMLNKLEFRCEDMFNFNESNKYDLSWNCGVIEHYDDDKIIEMIKKMASFVKKDKLVIVTIPNLLSPQSIYWMLKVGKSSERYLSHSRLVFLMRKSGLKNIQIKNFNYWLPSFFPYKWAIKSSNFKILNNTKLLSWLFSGIGTKF